MSSARRIQAMLEELVDVARLEGGYRQPRMEPVDLGALAREIALQAAGSGDGSRVRVESAEPAPAVLADRGWLERAVQNLITNALKYTPADGAVIVEVGTDEDSARVAVIDRGPGIPAEHLPHLFERGYQVSTEGKVEGLGLGLYIARLIAEAHGGRIWAESKDGKGSRFTIALSLPAEGPSLPSSSPPA